MKAAEIKLAWEGPPQCQDCGIRHLVLFSDLNYCDFNLIHQPIEEPRFEAKEYLYRIGEQPDCIFTLREGLVKLVQYLPNGNQRIVRLLKPGDIAGIEALSGEPTHQDAIALTPLRVCRIPAPVIERLSKETPRMHRQLMAHWQQVMNKAEFWLTELSIGPARIRVARLLVRLAEYQVEDTTYLPRREDIGAILGITTESASRITASFKREGFLEEFDNQRAIVDVPALRKLKC